MVFATLGALGLWRRCARRVLGAGRPAPTRHLVDLLAGAGWTVQVLGGGTTCEGALQQLEAWPKAGGRAESIPGLSLTVLWSAAQPHSTGEATVCWRHGGRLIPHGRLLRRLRPDTVDWRVGRAGGGVVVDATNVRYETLLFDLTEVVIPLLRGRSHELEVALRAAAEPSLPRFLAQTNQLR